MSSSVSLQTDVGALSMRGLAAFRPFLEAFSMDDVAPAAVLQLENLGASFLISGKYAECVPDYLQRHVHTPVGRMALSVGWRKGDTAAIMSSSAGGQAIALLCLCLLSLYSTSGSGALLFKLSQSLLPGTRCISSIRQLYDVGSLLQAKLEALGFGNELGKQVMRIHEAYDAIGKPAPGDLLELITIDSMAELLEKISKALQESTKIVRIRGTRGLGQVLALVTFLFPHDTMVTIEGLIIHEGPRRRIMLAIDTTIGPVSHFALDTQSQDGNGPLQDLKVEPNPEGKRGICSFVWNDWIAQWLQLQFLIFGLECPRDLLVCYSEILVHIPGLLKTVPPDKSLSPLPSYGLLNVRDPSHLQRIYECSRTVLGMEPSTSQASLADLYKKFACVASEALRDLRCCCTRTRCNFLEGWVLETSSKCKKRRLWNVIGSALDYLLWSLLISPGHNATVRSPPGYHEIVIELLHQKLKLRRAFVSLDSEEVHQSIMYLFSRSYKFTLGESSGAVTIFPSYLHTMEWPEGHLPDYQLREGQFLFNGRYYRSLQTEEVPLRKTVSKKATKSIAEAYLTSSGCHSEIYRSIHESLEYLELKTTIQISGELIDVDLARVIIATIGVQICDPCDHPIDSPISSNSTSFQLVATSVASPVAAGSGRIGIVQTRHNSTARLLACEMGVHTYFLGHCCLNCAISQIQELNDDDSEREKVLII